MRPDVYGCVSGGGPAITYLAGAADALDARCRVLGWSGASAGAIVATCKAFGVPSETVLTLLVDILESGQALTPGAGNLPRGGVFSLDVIGDAIDKHIGKGARLGDATTGLVVCVTDLDRARPVYLSKASTPKVLVREAVIASCSFMCGVTPAAQIGSLGTELSPDIRLWGDGGLSDNTVDGVWDHKREPRVGLRLSRHDGDTTDPDDRLRPGDVAGILAALPRALMWGASSWKSRRMDGADVEVDGVNDWSFRKDSARVHREWGEGYDSTARQVDAWLARRRVADKDGTP
jgi:predicted acylesterase/phospholipase RssA